jgi:hypothetical protein
VDRQFISFPKSGRSWVRFALHRLGVASLIGFHHDGFEYNDAAKPALDFDLALRRERYPPRGRVVYLERDPRDVMVSLFHQVTGRFADFFAFEGDISDFIRDPYFGADNLLRFQTMWRTLCGEERALAISYEACQRDFRAVLSQVLTHYEVAVDTEALDRAVAESDFASMQAIEQSGAFEEPWLRLRNGEPKVRRGMAGSFVDGLQPADIDYLNAIFAPLGVAAIGHPDAGAP